ncbi:MAG TPA: hypothetical protein VH371_12210 [Candidatus Limnocylindrales bacterium]
MTTWAEFEQAEPRMAARGRDLFYRSGEGEGLLITASADQPPRAHPVNAAIIDGHLYTFVQGKSGKRKDLDEDGRYAFHCHVYPDAPTEFLVRGHVKEITDPATKQTIADQWFWTPDHSYPLYELLIEHALLGERPTPNDYPPIYSSWKPAQ